MSPRLCGALLLVVWGGAAGCAAPVPPRRPPDAFTITLRGLAYHPDSVRVQVGDTLVWVNQDIVPHTVPDLRGTRGGAGGVALRGGDTVRSVVWGPGGTTLRYACQYHPDMTAVLVVH